MPRLLEFLDRLEVLDHAHVGLVYHDFLGALHRYPEYIHILDPGYFLFGHARLRVDLLEAAQVVHHPDHLDLRDHALNPENRQALEVVFRPGDHVLEALRVGDGVQVHFVMPEQQAVVVAVHRVLRGDLPSMLLQLHRVALEAHPPHADRTRQDTMLPVRHPRQRWRVPFVRSWWTLKAHSSSGKLP